MIYGWWSQNIGGASLFVHGYHWLPLANIDLVGDNSLFEVETYFEVLNPLYAIDSLRTLKVHHCLSMVTIGCPYQP